MNFEIITEKPLWFIVFCLLLGAAYVFFLYRNENALSEVRPWLKKLMAGARFIVVSLLAFLLLSPLIKTVSREVEKPIIILATDNSQSVLTGADSAEIKKYRDDFSNLADELKKDFDVRAFSFGDNVNDGLKFSFDEKSTDISSFMDDMSLRFLNRNVGAVILASDGLYNKGRNPFYSENKLHVPVFTVALGDTTVKKDIRITHVRHNRVAFLGNTFLMEVVTDALQCQGENAVLIVQRDSATLFSKNFPVPSNKYHLTIPVYIDAKQKGISHYKIKVSELSGEITYQNNFADVFIEVTENKQKVLLLANSPHPDLAAIKSVVESSQNHEIKLQLAKDFDGNTTGYNLVMLHQLPSDNYPMNSFFEKIKSSPVSLFFIIGAQTSINQFNQVNAGVSITESQGRLNEVQATPAQSFSLFTINNELLNYISMLAPLKSPFGFYNNKGSNYVLFNQQFGNVKSEQPLLFFYQDGERKAGVLAGEGFWKWKLKEFSENSQSAYTSELMMKIVQYLSVNEKMSPFRISFKNNFNENEPLIFDAELYNDAGELVTGPDVKMVIKDAAKKSYDFTFSKTEKAYSLNAGNFPVGNYSFRAEVKLGDKLHVETGEFSVSALQLELAETVADHQLLYAIAEKSGGKMFMPAELEKLKTEIINKEEIKPVIYSQKKLKDLVNLKWFFFLVIGFLSLEWFLRKRSGAY